MYLQKLKHRAALQLSDGTKLDVNFFLDLYAEKHSGKEHILDVLNSDLAFVPVENTGTGGIFFVNKNTLVSVEVPERDLEDEVLLNPEKNVQVELTTHETLDLCIFMEMREERSRVSDYLNFSPEFIYFCGKERDLILNKAFIFSVKDL